MDPKLSDGSASRRGRHDDGKVARGVEAGNACSPDSGQPSIGSGKHVGPDVELASSSPAPPTSQDDVDDDVCGLLLPQATVFDLTSSSKPVRLDVFLTESLPDCSRAQAQRLIEQGYVTAPTFPRELKPAIKLPAGTRVRVVVPPPRKVDLTPQDIPLEVLYEDIHLAVINKPAGLPVHPAPDQPSNTLVNALLFRLKDLSSIGGEERPGIVHRLDKETSGVLVVAKNDFAHRAISVQFKERLVHKTYLAIARGEPADWEGHIDLPLGRSYSHSKKQMVRVDGTGREAVTDYRVLEKYRGYALIECYPHTGRTHQIRVHLSSIRLPIACDKLYGRERRILLSDLRESQREADEKPLLERHALHAASISFRHPVTREEMTFSSGLHNDMHVLLKAIQRYRSFR